MNEFEKYWADQLKSCGATCERERILPPYQDVFLAGAAAMREKCAEVTNSIISYDEYDPASTFAAAIRKIEVK